MKKNNPAMIMVLIWDVEAPILPILKHQSKALFHVEFRDIFSLQSWCMFPFGYLLQPFEAVVVIIAALLLFGVAVINPGLLLYIVQFKIEIPLLIALARGIYFVHV